MKSHGVQIESKYISYRHILPKTDSVNSFQRIFLDDHMECRNVFFAFWRGANALYKHLHFNDDILFSLYSALQTNVLKTRSNKQEHFVTSPIIHLAL